MAQLQKEWKEIGPTNRKDTEHIWKRFIAACDHFYKQKNDANAAAHSQENENLEKKQGIIASLKEILESGNADGKVQDAVQKLSAEWNSIGHVPFAVKDETYKAYKDVLDEIYKKLNINRAKQRLDNFKNNIKNSKDGAQNERYRLERSLQQKISEMKQYENNLGFLTLSSKKGNSLISGINRKVENLKQEIELIKQKISVLKEQE
jgi:chromosome segregation ATPase